METKTRVHYCKIDDIIAHLTKVLTSLKDENYLNMFVRENMNKFNELQEEINQLKTNIFFAQNCMNNIEKGTSIKLDDVDTVKGFQEILGNFRILVPTNIFKERIEKLIDTYIRELNYQLITKEGEMNVLKDHGISSYWQFYYDNPIEKLSYNLKN